MPSLYVFLDESGNYDFSPTGTKYLVYTSLVTSATTSGVLELYQLKHRMIEQGMDIEYFHATEDPQAVRDHVLSTLASLSTCRVDSVVVEKCRAPPFMRPLEKFYPMMVGNLLSHSFGEGDIGASRFDKVLVFLDRVGSRSREREALIKGVKLHLARHLHGTPYAICMHQAKSHVYLQMVDYASWAVYVKWERGERRPFNAIRPLVHSETPVFERGYKAWY